MKKKQYFLFKTTLDSDVVNTLKEDSQRLNERVQNLLEVIQQLKEQHQLKSEENKSLADKNNEISTELSKKNESNKYLQEEFDNHIKSKLFRNKKYPKPFFYQIFYFKTKF